MRDRRQLHSQGPLLLGFRGEKEREGQGPVGKDPGDEIEPQAGCVVEIGGRFV